MAQDPDRQMRIVRGLDDADRRDVADLSPGERIEIAWEMSRNAFALMGNPVQADLHRDVVSIRRPANGLPSGMTRKRASPVISSDPSVLQGQTVFAGTRVPLDALWGIRKEGGSLDEFLLDYPTVDRWQAEEAWSWDDALIRRLIDRGGAP